MERLLSLMNEKNHYLEKFYSLAEESLPNFRMGQFETLDYFYRTREQILSVIKYIDSQLTAHSQNESDTQNETLKNQMKECIAIKEEYVKRIIAQDVEVLSCIEHAKNLIIKELQDVRRSKKAVSGYKAPTFQNRVDEEA